MFAVWWCFKDGLCSQTCRMCRLRMFTCKIHPKNYDLNDDLFKLIISKTAHCVLGIPAEHSLWRVRAKITWRWFLIASSTLSLLSLICTCLPSLISPQGLRLLEWPRLDISGLWPRSPWGLWLRYLSALPFCLSDYVWAKSPGVRQCAVCLLEMGNVQRLFFIIIFFNSF